MLKIQFRNSLHFVYSTFFTRNNRFDLAILAYIASYILLETGLYAANVYFNNAQDRNLQNKEIALNRLYTSIFFTVAKEYTLQRLNNQHFISNYLGHLSDLIIKNKNTDAELELKNVFSRSDTVIFQLYSSLKILLQSTPIFLTFILSDAFILNTIQKIFCNIENQVKKENTHFANTEVNRSYIGLYYLILMTGIMFSLYKMCLGIKKSKEVLVRMEQEIDKQKNTTNLHESSFNQDPFISKTIISTLQNLYKFITNSNFTLALAPRVTNFTRQDVQHYMNTVGLGEKFILQFLDSGTRVMDLISTIKIIVTRLNNAKTSAIVTTTKEPDAKATTTKSLSYYTMMYSVYFLLRTCVSKNTLAALSIAFIAEYYNLYQKNHPSNYSIHPLQPLITIFVTTLLPTYITTNIYQNSMRNLYSNFLEKWKNNNIFNKENTQEVAKKFIYNAQGGAFQMSILISGMLIKQLAILNNYSESKNHINSTNNIIFYYNLFMLALVSALTFAFQKFFFQSKEYYKNISKQLDTQKNIDQIDHIFKPYKDAENKLAYTRLCVEVLNETHKSLNNQCFIILFSLFKNQQLDFNQERNNMGSSFMLVTFLLNNNYYKLVEVYRLSKEILNNIVDIEGTLPQLPEFTLLQKAYDFITRKPSQETVKSKGYSQKITNIRKAIKQQTSSNRLHRNGTTQHLNKTNNSRLIAASYSK